jgi:hypothetical protein
MQIDIDKLAEAELIDLNNRIVERLRFLNQMRAHARCWSSRSVIVFHFNQWAAPSLLVC